MVVQSFFRFQIVNGLSIFLLMEHLYILLWYNNTACFKLSHTASCKYKVCQNNQLSWNDKIRQNRTVIFFFNFNAPVIKWLCYIFQTCSRELIHVLKMALLGTGTKIRWVPIVLLLITYSDVPLSTYRPFPYILSSSLHTSLKTQLSGRHLNQDMRMLSKGLWRKYFPRLLYMYDGTGMSLLSVPIFDFRSTRNFLLKQVHKITECFSKKRFCFQGSHFVCGGEDRVVVMVVCDCWWVCGCVNEVYMEITGYGDGCVKVGVGVWVGGWVSFGQVA